MFGIIRFLLAWLVVFAHIAQTYLYASALAVYAFYIFSGYLMTLIMVERYGFHFSGIFRYCVNRILRIYPLYWLLSIISLIFILYIAPEYARSVHPALRLPSSIHEILSNIFIIGLYPENILPMARLSPQAWALHVEVIFYLLIGLGLSSRLNIVILWLLLSISYHIYANVYSLPRYSPIFAASIAFSIGSLLYHLRPYLKDYFKYSELSLIVVFVVYFFFIVVTGNLKFGYTMLPFYLNLVLFPIFLYMLSQIPRTNSRYIKIDKWFGDLSYPIYLSHWIIAVIVSYMLKIKSPFELFLYCIPVIFIFSYIISKLIDNPIDHVRRRIQS